MIYHIIDIYDDGFSSHCVVQNNLVFIKPTLLSQTIKYPKVARWIEFWHSLMKVNSKRNNYTTLARNWIKKTQSKSQDKHSTSYPAANERQWHGTFTDALNDEKYNSGFLLVVEVVVQLFTTSLVFRSLALTKYEPTCDWCE